MSDASWQASQLAGGCGGDTRPPDDGIKECHGGGAVQFRHRD